MEQNFKEIFIEKVNSIEKAISLIVDDIASKSLELTKFGTMLEPITIVSLDKKFAIKCDWDPVHYGELTEKYYDRNSAWSRVVMQQGGHNCSPTPAFQFSTTQGEIYRRVGSNQPEKWVISYIQQSDIQYTHEEA
jgi:hypothetical protein